MEGIIKVYFDGLESANNPGVWLAKFYCEILGAKLSPALIAMFSKFTKLYGRQIVFKALVELTDFAEVDQHKIYGLISYLCKKHLHPSLNEGTNILHTEQVIEKINKTKDQNLAIRSPFDE